MNDKFNLSHIASLTGLPSPEAAVRYACRQLLEECCINKSPTPLKPLLKAMGISVTYNKALKGDALLMLRDGKLEIDLKQDLRNWRRQRFTLAHELVHVVVMMLMQKAGVRQQSLDAAEHSQLEALCDSGAAELLMPTSRFTQEIFRCGITKSSILQLLDTFLVSPQALLRRIGELVPNSSVIAWRKYSRHSREDSILRVVSTFPGYRAAAKTPWLPKGCTERHIIIPGSDDLKSLAIAPNKPAKLLIKLNDRKWECEALCVQFPSKRAKHSDLPQMESFVVPDPPYQYCEYVLIAMPIEAAERDITWNKLMTNSRSNF